MNAITWLTRMTFGIALMLGMALLPCRAAVYQWSVPIESVTSTETNDHPRAYLWVPPHCRHVRAVIVGQHNLLEQPTLESPILRKALTDLDMAEVWISPPLDGIFRFDLGAGEHFTAMMTALAQESGYSELQWVPIVPIGHSAMAGYPYYFAAWNPGRTLAAVSFKGQWPDLRNTPDLDWDNHRLDGVPLLQVSGEYEDANGRSPKAANFRKNYPHSPLTMLADVGSGHFDTHDKLIAYLALYLRKVVQCRLPPQMPATGPVTLRVIDPTKTGWLYDHWRVDQMPQAAAAPVGQYKGNPGDALWAFDGELAHATEAYEAEYIHKKVDLLGYVQDGAVVPQDPKTHQQVTLKFLPVGDGLTFKLDGTYIDTVPDGRPVGWTGLPAGSHVDHAQGGGPIVISCMTGPVIKVNDDTFAVRFDRVGFDNKARGSDAWFVAVQSGDSVYKRVVQQALLRVPLRNTVGADQAVSFADIPDQKIGTEALRLGATSSAGVPVFYYVEAGPAEIDGDTLRFTTIPPRAKLPVKVTVVAYQWGRSIEPRLKSAEPVTHTFYLMKQPTAVHYVPPASERAERAALWTAAAQSAQAVAAASHPAPPVVSVPQAVQTDGRPTVVSDTFTGAGALADRTPDAADLTGGKWQRNGGDWSNVTADGRATLGASVGDGIALGQPVKPGAQLTLAITFNLGTLSGDQSAGASPITTRGQGLGFFRSVSSSHEQGSDAFTGIAIDRRGALRLIVDGAGTDTVTAVKDFDAQKDHTLSYSVDTSTGSVTALLLDGSPVALSFPAATFTPARIAFVGFYTSGAAAGDTGNFDNFTVTAKSQ